MTRSKPKNAGLARILEAEVARGNRVIGRSDWDGRVTSLRDPVRVSRHRSALRAHPELEEWECWDGTHYEVEAGIRDRTSGEALAAPIPELEALLPRIRSLLSAIAGGRVKKLEGEKSLSRSMARSVEAWIERFGLLRIPSSEIAFRSDKYGRPKGRLRVLSGPSGRTRKLVVTCDLDPDGLSWLELAAKPGPDGRIGVSVTALHDLAKAKPARGVKGPKLAAKPRVPPATPTDPRAVVESFISEMCKWERKSWKARRPIDDELDAIFARHCVPRVSHPRLMHRTYSYPAEYDPKREQVVGQKQSGSRAEVQTASRSRTGKRVTRRYLLQRAGGAWQIRGRETSIADGSWLAAAL